MDTSINLPGRIPGSRKSRSRILPIPTMTGTSASRRSVTRRTRFADSRSRFKHHRIVNNYTRISFDFGPSLLSWMSRHDPETYSAILAGQSKPGPFLRPRIRNGTSLQSYDHAPGQSPGQATQVLWGFAISNGVWRKPEGMWLAETAVDLKRWTSWPRRGSGSPSWRLTRAQQTREDRSGRMERCQRGQDRVPGSPMSATSPPAGAFTSFFMTAPLQTMQHSGVC